MNSFVLLLAITCPATAANFTQGNARAVQYGVHEITFTASQPSFDTEVSVTFTSPQSQAITELIAQWKGEDVIVRLKR